MTKYPKSREELLKELEELKLENESLKNVINEGFGESNIENTREELAVIKESADEVSEFAENIINTVREPLLVLDKELRVVKASHSFFDFFKVSSNETIGTLIYDLGNHQWDIPKLRELLETILPEKTTFENYEVEHDFSTIGKRAMRLNARQIERSLGKEKIILLAIEDISERKEVQDALAVLALHNKTLLQTARDGIHILDENGNVLEANDSFCKLLGYTREELPRLNVADWDTRWSKEELLLKISELINHPAVFETNYRRKDGTVRDVELNCVGVILEGRSYLYVSARDITDQKQLLQELQDNVSRLELAMKVANLAWWRMDKASGSVTFSKGKTDMLGYPPGKFVHYTDFTRLVHPEDYEKAMNAMRNLFNGSADSYETEYRILTKSGEYKWFYDIGNFINKNALGISATVAGIVIDITERKQKEEAITKINLDLRRVNSEKDKFFSIIAHDLRSPFQGLLGLTEIMTSGTVSIEDYIKFSGALRNSLLNLYKLLENLLEWAMFQKGAIDFTPVELSLLDMFSHQADSIKERALQKGISVFYESTAVNKIYADEKIINTVLRNLLANALKFTDHGGEVSIGAKETEDGMIEISVTDTGIGIPKDVIDKLFILGEKVGTTGTDDEPSTGLGLILCKEFVEKHSGKIWVESQENVGSTFYFTIPKKI